MSSSDVLFQITADQLDTGLRGFPVGYCTTSVVYPEKGLYYGDFPVEKLATEEPEAVIHLLYSGKRGTKQEVDQFAQELKKKRGLKNETKEAIKRLPATGDPMKLLSCALLIAGIYESKKEYREDCLALIANIPEIVALVIRHHAGWQDPVPAKNEGGYIDHFIHHLNPPSGERKKLTEILKLFTILHFDHGGGNLSTFVGKAVASGLEDQYGSLAAAMSALAGPRHGRANQECLEFLKQLEKELSPEPTVDMLEKVLRAKLSKNELIFGFGHAVLRVEDPRATVLYQYAQEHFPDYPLVKLALMLRTVGSKVLKENPKIADPYTNVDAISGTLLSAAGFAYPHYFTLLFGMARTIGIAIQIVYERTEARGGKGTPIVRPKFLYKKSNKLR